MELDGQRISLETLARVAHDPKESVALSASAMRRMEESRRVVDHILKEGRTIYGINTGFGRLADVTISPEELKDLQLNLVRSHACGVGEPLSMPETRAMMLLRANVLALGFSGARAIVAEMLVRMIERNVCPVVPEKGSVGASGDLAPLAHLALTLIGEGEAFYANERMASLEALRRAGLQPPTLEAKEGLALLNGTQAMAAVGGLALHRAMRLTHIADVAGAMTLEALLGTPVAFDERIHAARPHKGQIKVAAHLLELLRDSEIRESHRTNDMRVQDSYSLRCMPQVHGATRDAIEFARERVEIETASATDNPLVFVETGEVISGGNFHGAPLALAFDYAAIALTHLANIIERRIERLVNPDLSEGLPPFLTNRAGTSSGFMIAQVTAVALLNEMKILAHPASTDNLPTSGGKEDHVSMGMTAATKLRRIVDNLEYMLAIELIAAAEGLEYRFPLQPGHGVRRAFEIVRGHVSPLTHDRILAPDFKEIVMAIQRGEFGDDANLSILHRL
jgi:histidine ammonia-lyase